MSRQKAWHVLLTTITIVGASVRYVLQGVVDMDSPEEWARLVNERANVFEKHMPIAFNKVAVAQHRERLRHTKTQTGTFTPTLQRFVAGVYVYLKRQKADSLDPRVGRLVLKVKSSRQLGPLGPRGARQEDDQGSRGKMCSLSLPQSGYMAESEASAWRHRPRLSGMPPDHWRFDHVTLRRL
jgi:hypothetical protein